MVHFIGRFLVQRILKPVQDIAGTARSISLKDLNSRVDTRGLQIETEYLADSFNEMIARLEKSFEYIKDFSSSISHELKTPLAIVKGEAEVALRRSRTDEDYRRALKVCLEEANRMINIVEELLFLTKLDYNPENIKKENFDFTQFLQEIQEKSRILASAKGIHLSARLPEAPLAMDGNKLHLARMFFNLVQNAVKFTPAGGKIDIAAKLFPDNQIQIAIADSGSGISEKDLPKVFNRFFHSAKHSSEEGVGIGLGLHIARSIARFHRGDIEVKSKFREGSVFTVTLPVFPS